MLKSLCRGPRAPDPGVRTPSGQTKAQIGLITLATLALAACASTSEPKIVIHEVKVPVTVACVPADLPAKPASYADDALTASTPADQRYIAIAGANQARKARLARIEPVIQSCR
jgi:hypothetical protein